MLPDFSYDPASEGQRKTGVLPTFEYEKKAWQRGFKYVAGADEVGRGALAGPLVAVAIVWERPLRRDLSWLAKVETVGINDSKKLSAHKREDLAVWIKKNALAWGMGEVSVTFINKHGIVKATRAAFRKAIASCNQRLQTTDYSLQKGKAVDSRLWT